MTNKEILQLAIEKAKSCGFVLSNGKHIVVVENDALGNPTDVVRGYESIIFDHDFAKALWGEEKGTSKTEFTLSLIITNANCQHIPKTMPAYLYRLQEMAAAPDPVKYLEKFVV